MSDDLVEEEIGVGLVEVGPVTGPESDRGVLGVGQGFEEVLVAAGSAAVFGWAGVLAEDASDLVGAGSGSPRAG